MTFEPFKPARLHGDATEKFREAFPALRSARMCEATSKAAPLYPYSTENPLPTFPDEIIVAKNEACFNERVTRLKWMFLTCNASWENVR